MPHESRYFVRMGEGLGHWLEVCLEGLVQLSGSQDVKGALITAGIFALWWLWSWHRRQRKEGKPGVQPHYVIFFSLLVATLCLGLATVGYGWKIYKDHHPSPDPKTGIVAGPYSKPDVDRLIGVFMSLDDVLTDKAENVFVINGTRWGSLNQPLRMAGTDGFAAQIPEIRGRIDDTMRSLRAIANKNNNYGSEIEPAISDASGAEGQVDRRLNVLGHIIEATKGLDEQRRQDISQYYVQDLDLQIGAYNTWVGTAHANIAAKLAALRKYK